MTAQIITMAGIHPIPHGKQKRTDVLAGSGKPCRECKPRNLLLLSRQNQRTQPSAFTFAYRPSLKPQGGADMPAGFTFTYPRRLGFYHLSDVSANPMKLAREKWRYRCPRGHTNWSRTNSHFWCKECANAWDVDPEFHALTDAKTREQIPRAEVEFDD